MARAETTLTETERELTVLDNAPLAEISLLVEAATTETARDNVDIAAEAVEAAAEAVAA